MFETLVLPHPATRGAGRVAELVLTAISLPLVLAGVGLALTRRRSLHRVRSSSAGELTWAFAITVFGVLFLRLLPVVWVAVPIGAVWARAVIRVRARGARGRDLQRIERVEKPVLPAARVLPAAGASPTSRDATLRAPDPSPAPPAPGDGPRLLH
jgi:hypothetical protein